MVCVREFEIFEESGMFAAEPVGMEGGTCAESFEEAVEMAADWLKETANAALARGDELETVGSIGSDPEHGGKVVAIAVECGLDKVEAVTAAEAARMLGVSSARIAQMCESGRVTSWRDGTRRMVALRSVEARLENKPKAGRPRRRKLAEA